MEKIAFPKFENILPGEQLARRVLGSIKDALVVTGRVPYSASTHASERFQGLFVGDEVPNTGAVVMLDEAIDG